MKLINALFKAVPGMLSKLFGPFSRSRPPWFDLFRSFSPLDSHFLFCFPHRGIIMKANRQLHHRRFCVLFSLVPFLIIMSLLYPALLPAAPPSSPAVLSKTELPARGRQESIFTITKFGRYAVTVKSDQGTGLQLIDRMAGPGTVSGASGERDGRLDLFLERGDYKIVTHGHEKASGTVHLEAHPFGQ